MRLCTPVSEPNTDPNTKGTPRKGPPNLWTHPEEVRQDVYIISSIMSLHSGIPKLQQIDGLQFFLVAVGSTPRGPKSQIQDLKGFCTRNRSARLGYIFYSWVLGQLGKVLEQRL